MIDVIIPVYNQEKYLRRCLDSLLPQTDESIKVFLVNDGSTDGSLSICREYAATYKNVEVIDKKNGGLSSARNAGLNAASGEHVVFIDSDDYVSEDYIARVKESAERGDALTVFPFIVKHIKLGENTVMTDSGEYTAKNALCTLSEKGMFNLAWNKVYSRRIIETEPTLRFTEGGEPGEDLLFNCDYFKRIDSVYVSEKPVYYYMRNGEDTLANRFRKNLWDNNKIFIDKIKSTFAFFNVEDEYGISVLSAAVLNYVHSAIPNMYRKKHKFKKCERLGFYNEIIASDDFAFYFNNLSGKNVLLNKLKKVYSTESAVKMDRYYSLLMFIRNNFTWLYNILRRIRG